eukprot:2188808-Amphidinium_carterae.1
MMTTSRARKVATFIVYVDDLLAVGSKKILEGFFKHMQTVWDIATPEYPTGKPEDVEYIRFLGMEIEKDNKTNDLQMLLSRLGCRKAHNNRNDTCSKLNSRSNGLFVSFGLCRTNPNKLWSSKLCVVVHLVDPHQ